MKRTCEDFELIISTGCRIIFLYLNQENFRILNYDIHSERENSNYERLEYFLNCSHEKDL
jgi:hypothetical protein